VIVGAPAGFHFQCVFNKFMRSCFNMAPDALGLSRQSRGLAMRRRDFIAGLGSAAAWPVVAPGQPSGHLRRVGILLPYEIDDPDVKGRLTAFLQSLAALGWMDGHNISFVLRWSTTDAFRMQTMAKELVDLQPDVLVVLTTPATAALQRETRTIPIVFVSVSDPVGDGFVQSLPHPTGNLTGFSNLERSMGGKSLALLKELVPGIKRAAIIFNPETAPGKGLYFLPSFEDAARLLSVEPKAAPVRSDADIEAVVASLVGGSQAGLVVMSDAFMAVHRAAILSSTAKNKVPAVYASSAFVKEGGLLSYGFDLVDQLSRAAPYVDRILRGSRPSELPVQLPVKFELAINLKTAKALGLDVPTTLLVRADEVIE
jgi:putative tryptophan/tyrosine transport system substrate-binding protein